MESRDTMSSRGEGRESRLFPTSRPPARQSVGGCLGYQTDWGVAGLVLKWPLFYLITTAKQEEWSWQFRHARERTHSASFEGNGESSGLKTGKKERCVPRLLRSTVRTSLLWCREAGKRNACSVCCHISNCKSDSRSAWSVLSYDGKAFTLYNKIFETETTSRKFWQ